jgi:Skp family chaperone for outer membrane proteins
MKYRSLILTLVSAAILIATAVAQNPIDIIGAPVSEQINQAQAQLQQTAAQHIAQGNVTPEHLQKDLNATAENLTKKASEQIKQYTNISQQEIQQRAKQELQNQVNQKLQQPGFEAIFAVGGVAAAACLLRRRS